MTGEITLRGQVMPVGGIKDKVLADHRFGVDTVILPKKNENDLDDLPDEVRNQLHFVLAEQVDDVLNAALMPAESKGYAAQAAPPASSAVKPKKSRKVESGGSTGLTK